MIREEEIKIKALSEYRIKEKENKKATGTYDANLPRRKAFQAGAKWADKTMIEKACEWMRLNAEDYVVTCYDKGELDSEGLLIDFRKAMEE